MSAARTALVTGCAGFIGSQLTESLLADGVRVIGVDCFNDNYGRGEKLRNLDLARGWEQFEFVPLDLARGDLGDLLFESDVVFHLAAEPGVRASWGTRFENYMRNNVSATQHLLEAATLHPGRRFVFASSSSVYGSARRLPTPEDTLCRPYSPYGVTKLAAEHMCLLYHANLGVDVVALRLFSVFGPRQRPDMAFRRFCHAVLSGEPIRIFGDGEQTRDFTYVGDVVRALRAAASTPAASGRVYNIGGGNQVSVNQALRLLEGFAERRLDVEYVAAQRGDVERTAADTARARAELGFAPSVGIADGLSMEFEWVREHGVAEAGTLRPR